MRSLLLPLCCHLAYHMVLINSAHIFSTCNFNCHLTKASHGLNSVHTFSTCNCNCHLTEAPEKRIKFYTQKLLSNNSKSFYNCCHSSCRIYTELSVQISVHCCHSSCQSKVVEISMNQMQWFLWIGYGNTHELMRKFPLNSQQTRQSYEHCCRSSCQSVKEISMKFTTNQPQSSEHCCRSSCPSLHNFGAEITMNQMEFSTN